MSNGRPFRDNTFKPNGRPFTDESFKLNGRPFLALQSKIDELKNELNEFTEGLDGEPAEEAQGLVDNLLDLEVDLDELQDELKNDIDELEGEELGDVKGELEELQEGLEKDFDDLERDLDEIENEIEEYGKEDSDAPEVQEREADLIDDVIERGIRRIIGTRRGDVLMGSSKNDRLIGRKGNDRLIGKKGDDILTGGLGKDKFMPGKGDDVITDFEVGVDRLIGKFKQAELSSVEGGTLVEYKKGSVLFEGLEIAEVEALL